MNETVQVSVAWILASMLALVSVVSAAPEQRGQRRVSLNASRAASVSRQPGSGSASSSKSKKSTPRPKPPVQPTWRYIMIHHSATAVGNAARFNVEHLHRGMVNGLAYHFVIDNGSAERRDGQVETGSRWTRQLPGGHCHREYNNQHGIGICLVGDFTRRQPSPKQMAALVNLVNSLRKRFNIPLENIRGHGQCPGESSTCPGRSFPWREFKRRLTQGK